MKNLKFYLVASGILFVVGLGVTVTVQQKLIAKHKKEIGRLSDNNNNLMQEGSIAISLLLKEKEVTGRLKRERDSIAHSFNTRPKNIIKLTYTTIKLSLGNQSLIVKPKSKNNWTITDTTNCYVWKGAAILKGDSLQVERLFFRYDAQINSTYYKKRPHKFLGIPVGRFVFTEITSSKCGTSQTKIIEFTR